MKMNLPKTIMLYCQKIDLIVSDGENWQQGSIGRFNEKDNNICLDSRAHNEVILNTILHEVIHAILCTNCLDKKLKSENEELAVGVIVNGLISFIRSNKPIIHLIMGDK